MFGVRGSCVFDYVLLLYAWLLRVLVVCAVLFGVRGPLLCDCLCVLLSVIGCVCLFVSVLL